MSGFVPPNPRPLIAAAIAAYAAQNNPRQLIAEHVAQNNPHPAYISRWVSGTQYRLGDVVFSSIDYTAYRSKINFVIDGDMSWEHTVCLLDVQNNAVVDLSKMQSQITTSGNVNYPDISKLGHKLIGISNLGNVYIPGLNAQYGYGDFCIEIFVNQYASPQVEPTVLSSNDGSDSQGYYEVNISRSSLTLSVRYGGAAHFSFDAVNGEIYFKLSRSNGIVSLAVNGAIVGSQEFGLFLNSSEYATFGNGTAGNFGLRLTKRSRSDEVEVPEIWPIGVAVGPSTIDPAVDPDHWELVYNPPDVNSAVAQAVADALPGIVDQHISQAVSALIDPPTSSFCIAVAAANVINSSGQGA